MSFKEKKRSSSKNSERNTKIPKSKSFLKDCF